jgi:hypothetical protein
MMLRDGVPKPISGDPRESIPTSSDIHAYIDDFYANDQLTFKTLLLDCEGAGGSLQPITLSHEATDKRKEFVNMVYPCLLYLLSNVVCYVTTLAWWALEAIAEILVVYASQAASATVNQCYLPTLLLIFNKVALGEGKQDVETASNDFHQHSKLKFFSKIVIVCILLLNYNIKFVTDIRNISQIMMQIWSCFWHKLTN